MSVALFSAFSNDSSITLTLSGETIDNSSVSGPLYARLKVDNDGKVYKSTDTGTPSWVQIDTTTDWVRPAASSPGAYEVRFTASSTTPTSSTTAEDTWHPMTSGDWILYNFAPAGTKASTFTLEIRDGSTGPADVSASYTVRAEIIV